MPRLEHLTARLQISQLKTLYDTGGLLALEWALHLEIDLHHYQCGAKAADCAYVVIIGEPKRPLQEITQGVPHRLIRPQPR